MGEVAEVVPAERLVATVAGQDDRHVSAGLACDVPRGDRGRIGERFAEVCRQFAHECCDVRLHDVLSMVGLNVLGDAARSFEFASFTGKSNGQSTDAGTAQFREVADDETRIHSAGKKRAERDFAHQPHFRRAGEFGIDALDCLVDRHSAFFADGRRIPVARRFESGSVDRAAFAGAELLHAFVDRPRRRDVAETKEEGHRCRVGLRSPSRSRR